MSKSGPHFDVVSNPLWNWVRENELRKVLGRRWANSSSFLGFCSNIYRKKSWAGRVSISAWKTRPLQEGVGRKRELPRKLMETVTGELIVSWTTSIQWIHSLLHLFSLAIWIIKHFTVTRHFCACWIHEKHRSRNGLGLFQLIVMVGRQKPSTNKPILYSLSSAGRLQAYRECLWVWAHEIAFG